ncbi:RibD family protein [Candidatus Bathyarchaeota archaeon]|nr:MAG: RibD family protein [Candidatus Bathyarchaeota archaeon]
MVRTVQLFEDPNVSIDQLSEFYKVEGSPHTYLMFVTTIDGIAVPLEPGQRGGSEIALRHLKDNPLAAGGLADNRALQYGWATADAVLGGAGILRDNPAATWYPRDKDLLDLLTKRKRKPVRAVVTGRGEVDLKHPVFNPKNDEWQPVIFTTKLGEEKLKSQAKRLQAQGHIPLQPTKTYAIGDTSVDVTKAVGILRKDYRAKLLDIQGGPTLAGGAVKAMLIDELRLTVSPQIMGDLNSEGKRRLGFVTGIHFGLEDSPLAELEAVGVSGSHIFLRYLMNYRN